MRRRLALLPIVLLWSLITAVGAAGGGWAEVTVTEIPADPPTGTETAIELMVMQHGKTAVSWPALTVIATDAASGTVVRGEARAEGPAGAYVATLVFPTEGEWRLTFDSTELSMEGSALVRVVPAEVAAGATTPAGPFVALGLAVILSVALIAAAWYLRRSRGVRSDVPASARS